MKLSQIDDALAVADNGSLRAAARRLSKAQPAMTRSLRELEHELGAKLFDRLATGVSLTALGEHFIRRARVISREVEKLQEEIDQLRGNDEGTVAVGLSMAAHLSLLPDVLSKFTTRYPRIRLTLFEGLFPALGPLILDGRIDLYVGPLSETRLEARFSSEKLFDNKRLVFGRRDHPMRNARSLSELVEAEWVATTITEAHAAELAPLFALHGLPQPRIVVTVRSALSAVIAVANSDLLAMLPRQWLQSQITRDLLTAFSLEEEITAPPIAMVHNAAMAPTPAAEHFGDLIRRAAAKQNSSNA